MKYSRIFFYILCAITTLCFFCSFYCENHEKSIILLIALTIEIVCYTILESIAVCKNTRMINEKFNRLDKIFEKLEFPTDSNELLERIIEHKNNKEIFSSEIITEKNFTGELSKKIIDAIVDIQG